MTIKIFGTPAELADFFKTVTGDNIYIDVEEDEDEGGGEGKGDGGDEKFNEFAPEV